jgi:hypothetical protein
MNIYGQLENATFENLSADPSTAVQGRFWYNSTTLRPMLDDGTLKRALLRNDQNCIFGNNGTAANNVRLNRSGAALLQLVVGSDATAEGSLSTSLAQLSAKHEGYANASKPANGNAGRLIWITDSKVLSIDDGASWLNQVDVSTAQTLTNKTLTLPAVDIPLFTDQGSDPSAPAAGKTSLYTKGTHVYKISNGGAATQLQEVGVIPGETVQSKSGTYSAVNTDDTIVCSGASWTLTLYDPTTGAGNKGKRLKIVHNGTLGQVYTLATTGGTIGGIASLSYALYTPGEMIEIQSDGSANWVIINRKTALAEQNNGALFVSATSAYVFTVTAANATAGAIYSNNGFQYTVSITIAGTTTLTCFGTGAPAASGTLTKVSGTGDATITFSARTVTGVPAIGAGTNQFVYWRNGNRMEFAISVVQTGAGTTGTGIYCWQIPTTTSVPGIDLTNIVTVASAPGTTARGTVVGEGTCATAADAISGGTRAGGVVLVASSTFLILKVINTASSADGFGMAEVGSANYPLAGATTSIFMRGSVPILGWQP